MKTALYNQSGSQNGHVELSDSFFARPWNPSLVHQVLVSYQANMRGGLAHTKDRSEVAGSGKKPWKQKGTGRARHGDKQSPIWVGGGVTFGPRNEKDYSQKINRKAKFAALSVVFSKKLADHKVLPVDAISLSSGKTKELSAILSELESVEGFETLSYKNRVNVLIVVPEITKELIQAASNLPQVTIERASRVNALQVAQSRYVVLVEPEKTDALLVSRAKNSNQAQAN
jgi:large subunit ribosomal protein L4